MKYKKEGQGLAILLLSMCLFCAVNMQEKQFLQEQAEYEEQQRIESQQKHSLYAGVMAELQDNEIAQVVEHKEEIVAACAMIQSPETAVFSFLQGPKSWGEGRAWAGEWANQYVNRAYFGNFGCGLCCMANIYSTLSDYECSPWDMLEYARAVSGYYPNRKNAAIGWADMKVTLRKSGFDCSLNLKPATYEEFQQQIKEAQTAVVLVSSKNDDTFWKNTGGHYVNIWLYDETTDEVFLTDPGKPERNRQWIPLRYVYDALKTASQYQYLLVNEYVEENNLWKQDGIDEAWVSP